MHQLDPIISIAILLAAALVGGMIAHRLRQPVILGYLLVGIAVGPYSLGLVSDLELVETVATSSVLISSAFIFLNLAQLTWFNNKPS